MNKFVKVRFDKMVHINGKWTKIGRETARGVRKGNRVYIGKGKYKILDRATISITEEYHGIPKWATNELISIYKSKEVEKKKIGISNPNFKGKQI